MKKIFRKYTSVIITAAICLILVINTFFTAGSIILQQRKTFYSKISQIINTLENRALESDSINRTLGNEYLTRAKIADNAEKELNEALGALMPDAAGYEEVTKSTDTAGFNASGQFEQTEITRVFEAKNAQGEIEGYVFVVETQGYAGVIGLRVGVKSDGAVSGVVIGESSETPGLGARASEPEWLGQFSGRQAPFSLDNIDAITSATYTSRYVIRGVYAACAFLKEMALIKTIKTDFSMVTALV